MQTNAQDISAAQNSAQRDLLSSIDQLNKLRSDIASEKIPIARRISEKERSILALRNEAAKIRAAADNKTLALEDIRNEVKEWENNNNFLLSLLDEYARRFESNLNISEREIYSTEIDQFNSLDPNQVGSERLNIQMQVIDQGFSRLRNAFNGTTYQSKAITEEGVLLAGQVNRFGPLAYYYNQAEGITGLIVADDGNIPHLFTQESGLSNLHDLMAGQTTIMPIDVTNGKAISIEIGSEGLLDHIGKGGIWIIPILLFAGISTVISIIKVLQIYKIKLPVKGSVHQVLSKLQSNNRDEAKSAAGNIPYPIGDMVLQGVIHADDPKELIEEIMYESMLEIQPKLEKYLPLIAISAATAPLLGLLGTVTGMINTFQLITLFGTGDAQSLSSGISEALITTEFGLIVAIPALIMHALLSRKVQAIMTDMEKYAVIFVNGLPKGKG